jgi:hypothetical protein
VGIRLTQALNSNLDAATVSRIAGHSIVVFTMQVEVVKDVFWFPSVIER